LSLGSFGLVIRDAPRASDRASGRRDGDARPFASVADARHRIRTFRRVFNELGLVLIGFELMRLLKLASGKYYVGKISSDQLGARQAISEMRTLATIGIVAK
jgi:hypothetical protein